MSRARLSQLAAVAVVALALAGCTLTQLMSASSTGVPANESSFNPAISPDGTYVAFASYATNLVPEGASGTNTQVYLKREASQSETGDIGAIEKVSVGDCGQEGNDSSGFTGFDHDVSTAGSGRYVAFISIATNLVDEDGDGQCDDDTNGRADVFVRDRVNHDTIRVSRSPTQEAQGGDNWGPSISGDGQWIAFASTAGNLVADDTNGDGDVFVVRLQGGAVSSLALVSRKATGTHAPAGGNDPAISYDGRYVSFNSFMPDLSSPPFVYDAGARYLYRHDRIAGTNTAVPITVDQWGSPHGGSGIDGSSINNGGALVAFEAGDDVYVRDLTAGTIQLVNVTVDGGASSAFEPSISSDGRWVAFSSGSANLVTGVIDTNGASDVFMRDRSAGKTYVASWVLVGEERHTGDGTSADPSAASGRVAFESWAHITPSDTNSFYDIYRQSTLAGG